MNKVKIGIIGCGNISNTYFINCKAFEILEVAACADIDVERARAKAAEHQIPKAYTVEELLADPEIQIVINLTIPKAHAEVCLKVLEAGKHVYVEKPLAVTREEGQQVLKLAKARNLLVGSAPDTFLGGGIQTCCKLINDGWIGRPLSLTAFMMCPGHEHWHPDPDFYYQKGGGPMFDMGPYYLTAMIAMLGPINRVVGLTSSAYEERTIGSAPKFGTKIQVNTPTHVAGMLDFTNGVVGTIVTSFDVFGGHTLPNIEIYGSAGTLRVPDPNSYGGPVLIRRHGASDWSEVALSHGTDNHRGIAVADMAYAISSGRPHRASGELAYHVLEAMHGFHDSSNEGKFYKMQSTCTIPAPLPMGIRKNTLDE